MDELSSLKKLVASQGRRIKELEDSVFGEYYDGEAAVKTVSSKKVEAKKESKGEGVSISFNQVITVLGILGISVGAISFFFYAVANGWIGKSAQVGIGVLFGFVLFAVAFVLRGKNQAWSSVVFGGAYFLEYLSIGVGVSVYEVILPAIGVGFGLLILISSVALCVKFNSRVIAYFSLVGGFLIPIITNKFDDYVFVMIWYLGILIALTWVSVSFDWSELRAVMLFFMTIFMYSSIGKDIEIFVGSFFLLAYFLLFNVSSLVNVVLNDKKMNGIDAVVVSFLPAIFLPLVYGILDSPSGQFFGLIIILFSFFYLLEAALLKGRDLKHKSVLYSLVAAGVATLNFGIYFLFKEVFGLEYFIIFFIVEWALFSSLVSKAKDSFYEAFSYVFLVLTFFWYAFVLRFTDGGFHATFFMVILALVPLVSFLLFRNNINYKVNAATFIVSGFLVLLSLSKALWYVFRSDPVVEIVLSVLWLVYTLTLFVQVQTKDGKVLVGVLLGVTLLKIAFRDLFFLEGAARIIGFIVFGVLLLVGGYFLKNEAN